MEQSGLRKIDISQRTFFIICCIITAAKLWFVRAHLVMATVNPIDDLLFIRGAEHIIKGQWLGAYNQLTLIKEPFYPIFIAVSHWLSIPLLVSQQLFYVLSCCVFIWAVRPLNVKRYILLLIYIILLLNPGSYNYPAIGRIFQLAVYAPLATILLSCLFGMALRVTGSFARALLWSVGLGLSMGIFWITRDESVFILPSILLVFLFLVVAAVRQDKKQALKVLVLCALPLLISKGIVKTIELINGHVYGVPYRIEIESDAFRLAYGTLLRIKSDKEREFYPVVRDVREKAYAVSPTFRKLKKYLEGPLGQGWENLAGADDIPAAFFIWAFRDSVAKAGYATSGPVALAFYQKMGQELSAACDSGKLQCRPNYSSIIPSTALVPPWKQKYNKMFFPAFYSILKRTVSFAHINAATEGARSRGPAEIMDLFDGVTLERLLNSKKNHINKYEELNAHLDKEKTRILGQIGWVYQITSPLLFVLALLVVVGKLLVAVIKRRLRPMTVFSISALGGIAGITFIMTLVDITSYSEVDRIMQVGFPIVLLFVITVFLDLLGYDKAEVATVDEYGEVLSA